MLGMAETSDISYDVLEKTHQLRIPTKPPGYTERVPRTVPI